MNSLIIDGIRWRIQQRNSEWSTLKSEVTMLIHCDLAHIVAEYCSGTIEIIPRTAIDHILHGPLVIHRGHTLNVLSYDLHVSKMHSVFEYKSCLRRSAQNTKIIEYRFTHDEYINFILTGYNDWIFGEIEELIMSSDSYDDDVYKPCCQNGDAKQLAEILLAKLRSQIVGPARDQKQI